MARSTAVIQQLRKKCALRAASDHLVPSGWPIRKRLWPNVHMASVETGFARTANTLYFTLVTSQYIQTQRIPVLLSFFVSAVITVQPL